MTKYKSIIQVYLMIFSVVIGTSTQGYIIYILNGPLDTIKIILNVTEPNIGVKEGLLVSAFNVGGLFGCILGLFLVKKSSRRRVIHVIDLLVLIGTFLIAVQNMYVFLLGRLIQGISAGLYSIETVLFLKEIIPIEVYGLIGGQNLVYLSVGTITQTIMALGFQDVKGKSYQDINITFWRIYIFLPCLFSFIRTMMFMFFFRFDSPVYYLQQQNIIQTEKFVQHLYKEEFHNEILENYLNQQIDRNQEDLFGSKLIKRTLLGIGSFATYSLSGIVAVISYSTVIFNQVTTTKIAQILTIGMGILKFLLYSTAAIVTQKFGRRKPALIGLILLSISLYVIGGAAFVNDSSNYKNTSFQNVCAVLIIIMTYFYFGVFFNSLGMVVPIYIPEILPERGVALTNGFQWTFTIIVSFLFPIVKEKLGIGYNFFGFGTIMFISFFFFFKYFKETKGLTQQQINILFQGQDKVFNEEESEESTIEQLLSN